MVRRKGRISEKRKNVPFDFLVLKKRQKAQKIFFQKKIRFHRISFQKMRYICRADKYGGIAVTNSA